jgi:oligopeptidase B
MNKMNLSQDHSMISVIVDMQNNERTTAFLKDITNNKVLPERISHCANIIISSNNRFSYYTLQDTKSLRSYKILSHINRQWDAFTDNKDVDSVLFEERDPQFYVDIAQSKDHKYYF